MAKLELQNLQKKYSAHLMPVRDVSLSVEDGEFLSLLGPSGCGKSTLLRLIAGLENPTQGRIVIGGKTVNQLPPGDRNVAMVFQSYALYPHLSAADNIASALKIRRFPSAEIDQRVLETAQKLKLIDGIKNCLPSKPGELSGGQRQRVALARALVRQPEVFLLDEPLSNLDALLREQVRSELKQIFQAQNKPVVYVTHDQTEAMTLSTRLAVLYNGLVQQLAPPHRIYSHPANQFVAGFVGSPQMNLLPLDCQGDTAILGTFRLRLAQLDTLPEHVVMGIRPEDIRLAQREEANAIATQVFLIEELGKEKLLSVRIQGTELTLRVLLSAEHTLEGETVYWELPDEKIHWFRWDGVRDPDCQQPLDRRDRLNL